MYLVQARARLGKVVSLGADVVGAGGIGGHVSSGADILSERFHGMTPEWHKEYEAAFQKAQNEAKGHFQRCPKCRKYVCESDWNEQDNLCVDCAPRENVEVTAARAEKMVTDIRKIADEAQVFTGVIDRKQTICPECGKPSDSGKFCNNCGTSLSLAVSKVRREECSRDPFLRRMWDKTLAHSL